MLSDVLCVVLCGLACCVVLYYAVLYVVLWTAISLLCVVLHLKYLPDTKLMFHHVIVF